MERTKIFELSLFIFRRDLRLIDNTALSLANQNSKCIIPAFFLDNRQVDRKQNEYFSSNSIQFMIESLANLNKGINAENSKLFLFHGDLKKNFELLLKENKIQAVYVNEDYTPFAQKRDSELKEICKKYNVEFISCEDSLLTGLNAVKLGKGTFFKKYTPYYNAASLVKIPAINKESNFKFINLKSKNNEFYDSVKTLFNLIHVDSNSKSIAEKPDYCFFDISLNEKEENFVRCVLEHLKIGMNKNLEIQGGRQQAEKKLELLKNFKDYKDTRNFPILPSTRLSAYFRFGCVSAREVFHIVKGLYGPQHDLIRQLHWRDFYMKIVHFYPHVIGAAMKPEYNKVVWKAKDAHIEAWKKGETGYPIVDAAMKCLNTTGYMHNRLRMIVSSFFVKDILADWRIGEKYFATQLVDYDISLNNGGWQWSASTGTDSQPYFRIFNPALQSEKFDKDCKFIFEWIPELQKVGKKEHVHDWEKFHNLYKGKINYPAPILTHSEQKEMAIKMFKELYADKDKEKADQYSSGEDSSEEMPTENSRKITQRKASASRNSKSEDSKKTQNQKQLTNKKKAVDDNQIDIMNSFKAGKKKK